MATIKAFTGFRPRVDIVDRVAALPYDVYNGEEAKAVVSKEPLSFLKIDRAETQFDDSVDTYAPCVYEKARKLLDGMIEDGSYVHDQEEVYYIYELTMDGRSQTGIVALASIDDYMNNVIKKHENTREEKEIDRITHVDTCNAQTGPIFLAYRSRTDINEVVNKVKQEAATYDFVADDNVRHRVWIIESANDIIAISNGFKETSSIYIADGHHRAASAVKVGLKRRKDNPNHTGTEEYNFFLSVLFPDEELMIMPYNRVVKDTCGLSVEELMNKISDKYDISKVDTPYQPVRKGQVGMYIENQWYKLDAHKDILVDDCVEGLDVSILQNEVLRPILEIDDPRTDNRIDFVGGIRGLEELERRSNSDMKLAYSMYPTSIDELFNVSDAGLLMPPKSTWFEPKLRSGIFIHQL